MAAELAGLGTVLQIKISGSYVTIPCVQDISWDGYERAMREVTCLTSTSRKFRPAILDFGEVSATIFYDPNDTTHQALVTKLTTPPASPDEFKLIYVDGNTTPANVLFKGYITQFPITGIEIEGSVESQIAIKVTDLVTHTAGTP